MRYNNARKDIKIELIKRGLKPSDVYKSLNLERAHFYQAIRSTNLTNKTLLKILDYLEFRNIYFIKT